VFLPKNTTGEEGENRMGIVAGEPVYEVVAPTGQVVQDDLPVNLRPKSLSGKTVGFVWDFLFNGPVLFEAIRGVLRERFADVRFIDHEYFGDIHGIDSTRVLGDLPEKLHEAGVDVAVVAVGA
jgi:hypothetical protein